MSSESSRNQNLVPFRPLCNPSPAVFNWEDKSISFLPRTLPTNKCNRIQPDLHSQNHQMLKTECSTMQYSLPITRHSLGRGSRTIQGLYPLANQLFVNVPNRAQNSNLLPHQVSSNDIGVIKAFHPSTANESNISQPSSSPSYQLPTNAMNQNSYMFNQQLPINASQIQHRPSHLISLNEFRRNQVKYPHHQQSERDFIVSHGLRSIFGHHSKEKLGILQNQYIPSQQNVLNRVSHPVFVNSPPEMRFGRNKEPTDQKLYPQYSENVQICVVGPKSCGKADLIRTFARNDDIRISTDKPLNWALQQGMASFGTTLKIDIWYGEDLISASEDIKALCQPSKSVIVLVYNAARKSTLLTVLEWVEFLKRDTGFKVPIILIGNVTDAVSSCTSKEFPKMTSNIVRFVDGVRARDEYGLAAFYECSTKCVKDVEAIFLTAALEAFHRTL